MCIYKLSISLSIYIKILEPRRANTSSSGQFIHLFLGLVLTIFVFMWLRTLLAVHDLGCAASRRASAHRCGCVPITWRATHGSA